MFLYLYRKIDRISVYIYTAGYSCMRDSTIVDTCILSRVVYFYL